MPTIGPRVRRVFLGVALAAGLGVATGQAQIMMQRWGRWRVPPRFATADSFDGRFNFCRGMYQSTRREMGGGGWSTDYPAADNNFMIRFGELTKASVSFTPGGEPNFLVVRMTDDALFRCPFVLMSDVGTAEFSDEEVARLRTYLMKGGFLWVDDFWGTRAWQRWEQEIRRVLPEPEYPIVDPALDHPVFHTLFDVARIPQIPSINHWRRSGGGTSERGPDSASPEFRTISDARGRIMVVMTHNTDIADAWEREGEDPHYFYAFSPEGYALAIEVVLYAMTH